MMSRTISGTICRRRHSVSATPTPLRYVNGISNKIAPSKGSPRPLSYISNLQAEKNEPFQNIGNGMNSLRGFSTGSTGTFRERSIPKNLDILSLNDSSPTRTSIRGFGDEAFQVNDTLVRNCVLCLPNTFLIWKNVNKFEDITLESLALFPLIYPTIEVLFIGCGETIPKPISPDIVNFFRTKGIIVEASNTVSAAATFNVLNMEGRNVAAALLTLKPKAVEASSILSSLPSSPSTSTSEQSLAQ